MGGRAAEKGRVVNRRYHLERLLGEGSLGRVYQASDALRGGRRVAIKLLRSEAGDSAGQQHLRSEFGLLRRFRHPNLVGVHDLGVDLETGNWFLTMEFIDGPTLEARDSHGRQDLLDVAVGLLRGLDYIHRRGVVHADVKPANVLLAAEGDPKIVDFGLAGVAGGVGPARGTLPFTAPEVLRGDPPAARSDLYSLGASLYHAAVGRGPFDADSPDRIIEGHLRGEADFSAELFDAFPRAVPVLLRRLLAKNPDDRPESATAVIATINELHGTKHALRADAERVLKRGPLVGRDAEIARIEGVLEDSRGTRRGRIVGITGPSGAGKTRVAEEIRTRGQVLGFTVAAGACHGEDKAPYDATTQVLRDLAALSPDPPREALKVLLDPSAAPPAGLDALTMFEGAAVLVRSCAEVFPLLLVFEDLHESGEDQIKLLEHLIRGTRDVPVTLIFTGRDQLPDALGEYVQDEPEAVRMPLPPLGDRELGALFGSLVEGPPAAPEVVEFLRTETGGNPYLIAETTEALLSAGALERTPDFWTLRTEALGGEPWESGLQESAQRTLGALDQGERELVEVIAAFGQSITRNDLEQILAEPLGDVRATLSRLEALDIVSCPDTSAGDPRFAVQHRFVRDAAYTAFRQRDPEALRALHQRIAANIERKRDKLDAGELARLGWQNEAAGREIEAANWYEKAAEGACSQFAFEAACRHFKRALQLMPASGEAPWPSRRAATWEALGDIHRRNARPGDADAAYTTAIETAPPEGRARLLRGRAWCQGLLGDFQQARELAEEGRKLFLDSNDLSGVAACENAIGVALARQGDHARAEEHYRKALGIRKKLGNFVDISGSLNNLGMVLQFQGRQDEALAVLLEALSAARSSKDDWSIGHVEHNVALVAMDCGRLDEARSLLESAVRIFEEQGSPRPLAQALAGLGRAEMVEGQFHEGAHHAARAAEIYRRLGLWTELSAAQELEGSALRESGLIQAALEAHERSLANARRANDESQIAFNLIALALDNLAAGDLPAAETSLEEARQLEPEGRGARLRNRFERVAAQLTLAGGRAGDAEAQLEGLLQRADTHLDLMERLEAELLMARTRLTRGDFGPALGTLDDIAARAPLSRRWETLRLRAQSLAGLGREAEAERARQEAVEALALLAAGLPAEHRAALEARPAATRLRIDAGGSDTSRLAPARILDTMYAVLETLTATGDADHMLEQVLELALELLGAERGLILLFPEDQGEPRVAASRDVEEDTVKDALSYSRKVVEEGRAGRSLVSANAHRDPRLKAFPSVGKYDIRSILCVPMASRDRIMGTVYLDSRRKTIGFDQDDLAFLEALAGQAATALDNLKMMRALERENLTLRQAVFDRYSFANLVGRSAPMQEVFSVLETVKEASMPVLVQGESGTGKELVARALHYNGLRKEGPFLSENCAALPETLLESQLFGHVRGAFTGATEHRGLFQEADGGTLFLDEIGEMSPALQARMTRVLGTREFRPVGGSHEIKTDVRVIAATHRDLESMVEQSLFRRDLFFLLNVIVVALPPLRDRREDIPLLVSHFLRELAAEHGVPVPGIEDGALEILAGQDWPGNVRQLRNMIVRLLVFRSGEVITAQDVRDAGSGGVQAPESYDEDMDGDWLWKEQERRHIQRALKEARGDRTRAARLLRVGRATVFRKIKEYKIDD